MMGMGTKLKCSSAVQVDSSAKKNHSGLDCCTRQKVENHKQSSPIFVPQMIKRCREKKSGRKCHAKISQQQKFINKMANEGASRALKKYSNCKKINTTKQAHN